MQHRHLKQPQQHRLRVDPGDLQSVVSRSDSGHKAQYTEEQKHSPYAQAGSLHMSGDPKNNDAPCGGHGLPPGRCHGNGGNNQPPSPQTFTDVIEGQHKSGPAQSVKATHGRADRDQSPDVDPDLPAVVAAVACNVFDGSPAVPVAGLGSCRMRR